MIEEVNKNIVPFVIDEKYKRNKPKSYIGFICWALVITDEETEADPISEETWDPNRSNDLMY